MTSNRYVLRSLRYRNYPVAATIAVVATLLLLVGGTVHYFGIFTTAAASMQSMSVSVAAALNRIKKEVFTQKKVGLEEMKLAMLEKQIAFEMKKKVFEEGNESHEMILVQLENLKAARSTLQVFLEMQHEESKMMLRMIEAISELKNEVEKLSNSS